MDGCLALPWLPQSLWLKHDKHRPLHECPPHTNSFARLAAPREPIRTRVSPATTCSRAWRRGITPEQPDRCSSQLDRVQDACVAQIAGWEKKTEK